jgi:hypothetical protein
MKKLFATLFTTLGLVSMQSCVPSLQQLATPDTIITDNRIVGNWVSDDVTYTIATLPESEYANEIKGINKDNDKKPLSPGEKQDSAFYSKMYIVSFSEGNVVYYMGVKLVKLDGQLFADIYPAAINDARQPKDQSDPFTMSNDYLGGFTIAKVEINGGNSLSIKFIDGNFMLEQIEKGTMRLKHESNQLFSTAMITASSDELRQFISKYGNDERIYGKKTINLTRRPTNL